MIKVLTVMLLAVNIGVVSASAAAMTWGSGSVYDSGGVLVVKANNWLHEFVNAGADNVIGGIDDLVVFSSTTWGGAGWWYHDTGTYPTLSYTPGVTYYSRIWDATTSGAATSVASVYLETSPTPAADPEWLYPTGAPNVVAGDWAAVPEPSTVALLALGAVVVSIRRKSKSSKA